MFDISYIEEDDYRKWILAILQRREHIWSAHLDEIKCVPHRIALKLVTRPISQQL